MFSPLKDQPQYVYVVQPDGVGAANFLMNEEARLPGILAYGHHNGSRTWNRIKKVREAGEVDIESFDYYRCFVPLNCAWLFEYHLAEAGLDFRVVEAVNVDDIFAWPTDPEMLETMAVYGRSLIEGMIERREVKPFVLDLVTDYQARAVYWAATRPWAFYCMPAGCVSGETRVKINRAGKGTEVTIKGLASALRGGFATDAGRGRKWILDIPTDAQSVIDERIRLNRVVDAFPTGKKVTWTVEAGEFSIRATLDHKFMTPEGFRELRDLRVGDVVQVRNNDRKRGRGRRTRYRQRGVRNHPYASTYERKRTLTRRSGEKYPHVATVCRVPQHRLVAEARASGMDVEAFVKKVRSGCHEGLTFIDPKVFAVHHVDHDSKNNHPDNLEVLTHWDHAKRHGDEACAKDVLFGVKWEEIKKIEEYGEEDTYDISMAGPHYHYVAEGFVVHNSGKTLSSMLASLTRGGSVCVVAPAKARRVWWDQVQEYTNIVPYRVIPQGQMRKGDQTLDEYLLECNLAGRRPFVVFGMQLVADYLQQIMDLSASVLIIDETHNLGQAKRWKPINEGDGSVSFQKRRTSTDTRETRAVAAMEVSRMPSLKLRIGLTATPLDDGRPRRLWSQLDLLAPGSFSMGFRSFALRYCGATPGEFGGLNDKGSSNLDELKARASYMLQEVTHTESHGQLPPTRVQVVWLDKSDQNRPGAFKRIIAAAEKQAVSTGTDFDKERAIEANLMAAASVKRRYILEEVVEGLRGGGKVVLFTARRKDCEDWADLVRKALVKDVKKNLYGGRMPDLWWGHGGTDEREREDMVSDFRKSDGPCILIGTGQAFGESVDGLQTASLAFFAMLPWRPGDFEQWKGRFDRIGGSPTLLKVVLAKHTYDEKIAGILADKMIPIRDFLEAEQYQGMGEKLLGTDDKQAMSASILASLFGGDE